jgi:hypothetical protein
MLLLPSDVKGKNVDAGGETRPAARAIAISNPPGEQILGPVLGRWFTTNERSEMQYAVQRRGRPVTSDAAVRPCPVCALAVRAVMTRDPTNDKQNTGPMGSGCSGFKKLYNCVKHWSSVFRRSSF